MTPHARDPAATPPAAGRTLAEAVPLFLEHLAADGYARHTVEAARLDLGQLGRFLGRQPLATVSAADLRAFFAWLRRQHGNRPASLRRKTSTVKGFFAFLHEAGLAQADPAAAVAYPPLERAPARPLTPAEAEAVPAGARGPAWRALVLALLDCGLKRDEAVALRWEDVELDPPPGRLHVRHRVASRRARRRTLGLGERLAAVLRELSEERGPEGAVFGVSARGVDFIVETCARRAGVRPAETVTPQLLRDAFAGRQVTARLPAEAAIADPAVRARAAREHDRTLLRELGLAESSDAAARYRRLVADAGSPEPVGGPSAGR